MTSKDFDVYFKSFLEIETTEDYSLNGLQVDNDGGDIKKAAFAVDASLAAFEVAAEAGAGLLFVHHGIFWGEPSALRGVHRRRLKFLLEHNIALYAVHLPLDKHPHVGNNAVMARLLGLEKQEPCVSYHGEKIGIGGIFPLPTSTEEASRRIFGNRADIALFPFGEKLNLNCVIVSGGAAKEVTQAIDVGSDLYITGEMSHSVYSTVKEARINMIAGGHYNTEIWGVQAVMQKLKSEKGIDASFIDLTTGL
jgi:dinuclear metal center YbgI/SA1388 family protein